MKIDNEMARIALQNLQVQKPTQVGGPGSLNTTTTAAVPQTSFADVLAQTQKQQINFSKHAQSRLNERGISLGAEDMQRLESAVTRASQKGIRNTLVLQDKNAFIVNIQSNTVVTAMNGDELKENVFTNIDGTVIV